MADSQALKERTLRDIFIKHDLESRFELGVKTITDVTFISLDDMKLFYHFSYVEQRKLRAIQMQCANISEIVPPQPFLTPLVSTTPFSNENNVGSLATEECQSLCSECDSPLDKYESLTNLSGFDLLSSLSGYKTPPKYIGPDSGFEYQIKSDSNGGLSGLE